MDLSISNYIPFIFTTCIAKNNIAKNKDASNAYNNQDALSILSWIT